MTKIYFIKRISDGHFYNAKEDFFTSRMCIASYNPKKHQIEAQIKHFGLSNTCEIFESNDEEFMEQMASLTTNAIIKAASLKKTLEDIKYILPTVNGVNRNLANFLGNTINHLSLVNPVYKEFIKHNEDSTDDVQGYWEEFMETISKVELYQTKILNHNINAVYKDSKSMTGLANKLLGYKLKID